MRVSATTSLVTVGLWPGDQKLTKSTSVVRASRKDSQRGNEGKLRWLSASPEATQAGQMAIGRQVRDTLHAAALYSEAKMGRVRQITMDSLQIKELGKRLQRV